MLLTMLRLMFRLMFRHIALWRRPVASSMYHLRINEPLYSQISNGLFFPNLFGHKKVHVKCEGVGS